MNRNKMMAAACLPLLAVSSLLPAARSGKKDCAPTAPAPCYPDNSKNCYCLGPENYGVNAPVGPLTCNGDLSMTFSGFYWNAHQDGMEYAIDNKVANPGANPQPEYIKSLNNLVDAEFKTPAFKWDFGFKLGLGYCTTRDGWDIGASWTWYQGKAGDHIEREADANATLLALWSAFAPAQGYVLYATDIATNWKLQLNLVDIELGRNFWTSKYLALRPFMGLRVAFLKQDFQIQHKGGSWAARDPNIDGPQEALNNEVNLDNDFKGAGLRAGLNSTCNFGSGWSLYGNCAASIVYGRFYENYDESNREAASPHDKTKVAKTTYSFRASRPILDLALGVQWATLLKDCRYGFSVSLGWEHHLFFDQNQMWRIIRVGDRTNDPGLPNTQGENVFQQRRGDLDTQGWTLTMKFDF